MGTHGADGASGATGYQRGSKDLLEVVGFVLGKGERVGEGGGETRIARNKASRPLGLVLAEMLRKISLGSIGHKAERR